MSGGNGPSEVVSRQGDRVAIVASQWHTQVMAGLIAGASAALSEAQASFEVIEVPGSFELPLGCQLAIDSGFDAVVALGVVIRGGTPHFDYVCHAATDGLAKLSLATSVPVGFGLLTCDNEEQAIDRAGLPGSSENKGREAAVAALLMLDVIDRLR